MDGAEETIEVAPVLFGFYAVTVWPGEGAMLGTERVPGTDDDRERWVAARQRYEDDYAHADAAWPGDPAKRPWWRRGRLAGVRWPPGYQAEQQARATERNALLARAEQRYQPVQQEIFSRVAAVREERERAARTARERQERLAAVAGRREWGWVRRGHSVALVFRHDVAMARVLRAVSTARGPLPLDDLGDELYEYGMTTVRWDGATKRAVAADCAAAGYPLTFNEWWAEVGPWKDPHRAPTTWSTNRAAWPTPTRRSRERLEHGTSHHSSYGVGDSGSFGSF